MADSCLEWIIGAFFQAEENGERGAGPPRNRSTIRASISRAYRRVFRIERPRFIVRSWLTSKEGRRPPGRSTTSRPAAATLDGLKKALGTLAQRRKEYQAVLEQVRQKDEELGERLLDVSPMALSEDDDFKAALRLRDELARESTTAQADICVQRNRLRAVTNAVCGRKTESILTPVFDELLRPLLRSLNSALDARSMKEELQTQLGALRQRADSSQQLLMTSGKGWRVSPIKITKRIAELDEKLSFLQRTEPSREHLMEKTIKAIIENETAQAWLHSNQSAEALLAAENYRNAVYNLAGHRRRLDNDKYIYNRAVLKRDATESQEQFDHSCLKEMLLATAYVKGCEAWVRVKRNAAIAAGADLICLDDANPDYITEIGHGVELTTDGRTGSEASEELRLDEVHFQRRLDPILEWQSCLHKANNSVEDVEIPGSPTSSAESNTSEYYRFYPWDVSADIYERRLVPCDSMSNVNWGGMRRKVDSEQLRQETARDALGVRSSSPPRNRRREDARKDDRHFPGESRGHGLRSSPSRDRYQGEDRALRRYDRYMPEEPVDAQRYDEYRSSSPRGRSQGENRTIRRDSRDLPE